MPRAFSAALRRIVACSSSIADWIALPVNAARAVTATAEAAAIPLKALIEVDLSLPSDVPILPSGPVAWSLALTTKFADWLEAISVDYLS